MKLTMRISECTFLPATGGVLHLASECSNHARFEESDKKLVLCPKYSDMKVAKVVFNV